MSKTREFDEGKLKVTFTSEEAAKRFDEYLDSEWEIVYNGSTIGSVKVRDEFDPYKFFTEGDVK